MGIGVLDALPKAVRGRDNREVGGNQPTGSEATMFPILGNQQSLKLPCSPSLPALAARMATSSYQLQLQLLVDLVVGGSSVANLIVQHSEEQRLVAWWLNGQSKQRMEYLREMALLHHG